MDREYLVIGMATHCSVGTKNELSSEESFEHISVLQEINQYVHRDLRSDFCLVSSDYCSQA